MMAPICKRVPVVVAIQLLARKAFFVLFIAGILTLLLDYCFQLHISIPVACNQQNMIFFLGAFVFRSFLIVFKVCIVLLYNACSLHLQEKFEGHFYIVLYCYCFKKYVFDTVIVWAFCFLGQIRQVSVLKNWLGYGLVKADIWNQF